MSEETRGHLSALLAVILLALTIPLHIECVHLIAGEPIDHYALEGTALEYPWAETYDLYDGMKPLHWVAFVVLNLAQVLLFHNFQQKGGWVQMSIETYQSKHDLKGVARMQKVQKLHNLTIACGFGMFYPFMLAFIDNGNWGWLGGCMFVAAVVFFIWADRIPKPEFCVEGPGLFPSFWENPKEVERRLLGQRRKQ